jgi:hypothetical protein
VGGDRDRRRVTENLRRGRFRLDGRSGFAFRCLGCGRRQRRWRWGSGLEDGRSRCCRRNLRR